MNVISWTAEKQALIPQIPVPRLRAGHRDVTALLCSSPWHDPSNGWHVQPVQKCGGVIVTATLGLVVFRLRIH